MNIQASTSEDHGIALLTSNDLNVYSVGISTGGVAEIRMAQASPGRQIIATTIDEAGAAFAEQCIAEHRLDDRITVKIEDAAGPLPYDDGSFDYIYARLVLHYLPKDKLISALAELYRVLKPGGTLFVVVRSTKCPDASGPNTTFDPETQLTTYADVIHGNSYSRFFHTETSISEFVRAAGLHVISVTSYDEHLFADFMRTVQSPHTDNVIELVGKK
ncbi:MAG TPA: methyltransferase domain-containing protein [Candidatus Saccharimonadales bacterium]|nr:methyltransferase domain-containing protein [Candidatus Saccharimonadales bacterium]